MTSSNKIPECLYLNSKSLTFLSNFFLRTKQTWVIGYGFVLLCYTMKERKYNNSMLYDFCFIAKGNLANFVLANLEFPYFN